MNPEAIQKTHAMYLAGKMSPDDSAAWKAAIDAGEINPADFETAQGTTASAPAEDQIIVAHKVYLAGKMSPDDSAAWKAALESGEIKLPENAPTEPDGFWAGMKEKVTGNKRSTPEIEAMPGFRQMPEKNNFSLDAMMASLGMLTAPPEEVAQIMAATFPEVGIRQDEKGNFIFTSAIDGKDYAIHPGLEVADVLTAVPKTAAFMGATVLTGGGALPAIGASMAIEAADQGVQKAAGGEFNFTDVALAGAGEGIGQIGGKVWRAMKAVVQGAQPTPVPVVKDLTALLRDAARGDKKAVKELVQYAEINPEVRRAADDLGLELTPNQLSGSKQFRETYSIIESTPGSRTATAAQQSKQQVSEKAAQMLEDMEGLTDLAQMDTNLKKRMDDIRLDLNAQSDAKYAAINSAIPPTTAAPATNLVFFLKSKAEELGGEEFLDPLEKKLLAQLSPVPAAKGIWEYPTYARLDNLRKKLTAARVKGQGEFKDADHATIKRLEHALLEDQKVAAQTSGVGDLFEEARKLVAMRKDVEENMSALFGRDLNKSIVGTLSTATKRLEKGQVDSFINLIHNVPPDMRQEVTATALNTAFYRNATHGNLNFASFSQWYKGLQQNKQAYTAVMVSLPTGARDQLHKLATVAGAIADADREFIRTGKLEAARKVLEGADRFTSRLWLAVKKSAPMAIGELGVNAMGLTTSGVGTAISIAAALKGSAKSTALSAADELLTSPAFLALAKDATPATAAALARTPAWKTFVKELGQPAELSDPVKWIMSAWQSTKQVEIKENE